MRQMTLHHSDCLNFCPVDVAKGLCRRTGKLTIIDSDTCDCYKQLPKCKFCANYIAAEEQLGLCKAEAGNPWAYKEMIAVTCEMFVPA